MANILIVEDSKWISKVISLILEKEHTVLSTSEGDRVVGMVKERHIDLVILDLMMPGVSGKEVFARLKADASTSKVKVLILTAKTDAARWYPELGACDEFMAKPFDNEELVDTVKKLLQ